MASLRLNQSQKSAVTAPAKPATTAQTEATLPIPAQTSPQIATTMPSAAKAPVVLVLDDDEEIPTLPDDDETPVVASTPARTLVRMERTTDRAPGVGDVGGSADSCSSPSAGDQR
jgi:hypothetical protein